MSGKFVLLPCFVEISVFINSVDPDQMPHSAASDLCHVCHCPLYGTLGINGLTLNHNCPRQNFDFFFFLLDFFQRK